MNKRELYESVMLDIAKIVKQRINELNEPEDYVQIDSEINKIVSKIAKDNSITRIPEDELKKLLKVLEEYLILLMMIL